MQLDRQEHPAFVAALYCLPWDEIIRFKRPDERQKRVAAGMITKGASVAESLRSVGRTEPKLHHIQDWFEGLSCAPTALAAISGKPLGEIGALLQEAANAHGRHISDRLLETYDLSDTLLAVKLMGSFWLVADEYERKPFEERPAIDQWGGNDRTTGVKLVFCDDGLEGGHIFAAHEGYVVDTYTKGHCIKFDAVPASYRKFRVKLTFLILVPAHSGG